MQVVPNHRLTSEERSRGGVAARQSVRKRILEAAEKRARVDALIEGLEAEKIPQTAYGAALQLMNDIIDGDLPPIETNLDLSRRAEAVSVLFKVARLASGESTSNTATITVTDEDAQAAQAERMRARLDALDTEST